MKISSSALVTALLGAVPALASVTVSAPAANSTVSAPFSINATATPCSGQAVSAMGYSLDNSSNTTVVNAATLSASLNAAPGQHVLHVKSWGNRGASCTANVNITVSLAQSSGAGATILSVAAPAVGSSLTSPFLLSATGSLCKSQPIAALGYSLDNSSSTTIVNAQQLNAQLSAQAGKHTLHIKAWGNQGSSCVSDVAVSVMAPPPPQPPPPPPTPDPSGPSIPSNARAVHAVHKLAIWQAERDAATGSGGSNAYGATNLAAAPSLSGTARQFNTTYTKYAGERYHVSVAPDPSATNFVYDTQIYIDGSSSGIGNIEMDLNQVLPNGRTIIMGFQCDGWSGTWDYTENVGSPTKPNDHWLHSNQTCKPQNWATNTWHHVQIQFSRDDSGNVTYEAVWLDGVQQDLHVTVPSEFALGWAPTLLHNFQVDGMTSGTSSSTIYLDNMTIYSW